MKKLLPILGLILGFGLGLLWPTSESNTSTSTSLTSPTSGPTLVEVLTESDSTGPTSDETNNVEVNDVDDIEVVETPIENEAKQTDNVAETELDIVIPPNIPPDAIKTGADSPPTKSNPTTTNSRAKPQPSKGPSRTKSSVTDIPPELPTQPKPKSSSGPRITPGQSPSKVIRQLRRAEPSSWPIAESSLRAPITARRSTSSPSTQSQVSNPRTSSRRSTRPVNGNYCPLVHLYDDWPTNVAYAVCMAESYGRPAAVNRDDIHYNGCRGSYGLFQIGCIHASPQTMLDPHKNVAKAHELYKRNNSWQPWSAYNNGFYRKYMPGN